MTTFTIKFEQSTDEWRVEVRVEGKRVAGRDYFTDDFEDAKATCRLMAKEARQKGEDVP